MPYAMPWHLTCLAVERNSSYVKGALSRLFTAYRLGTSKTLGTTNPELEKRAMIDPRDLFLEKMPSERDAHFNWTIRRAPADKPLPLIVISSQCFGIRTHYWAGRTGPCLRSGCDACKAGRLSRWTGYLACVDPADWSQTIFEYTPPAAEQLQKILAEQGYLRGSKIVASRTKKVKNARVNISSRGIYEHLDRIPKEPEILPILFHIWGLKQQEASADGAYDADSLAEHEKPKRAKKHVLNPSAEAIAQRLLDDLPGQARLFPVGSNGKVKT